MNKYTNKIELKLHGETIDKTHDDFEVLDYYPQLKLIKNCKYYFKNYIDYYFCFNYVFKDIQLSSCEEGYKKLEYEYNPIIKQQAKIGDIISFHRIEKETRGLNKTDELNCEHFAIISDIDIYGQIKIKSKWGVMGVFEGNISDLPDGYGNTYIIWRRKKKTVVKNETVRY